MRIKLTTGEKLKDLRVEKGLTLEELGKEIGISSSALSKYESEDNTDMSSYCLSELAVFYGVSTDYLLGFSENKNHPDTEFNNLHLDDDTINILSSGKINNRLLCEILKHKGFTEFLYDAEIFVNGNYAVPIQSFNSLLDTARQEISKKYNAQDDIYMRELEVCRIDADKSFSQILTDDLMPILKDIQISHKKDIETAKKVSTKPELIEKYNDYKNQGLSISESATNIVLNEMGINPKKLNQAQKSTLQSILGLSKKYKLSPAPLGSKPIHGQGKRKRK